MSFFRRYGRLCGCHRWSTHAHSVGFIAWGTQDTSSVRGGFRRVNRLSEKSWIKDSSSNLLLPKTSNKRFYDDSSCIFLVRGDGERSKIFLDNSSLKKKYSLFFLRRRPFTPKLIKHVLISFVKHGIIFF